MALPSSHYRSTPAFASSNHAFASSNGFTLIEALIVLAILALLASLAMPDLSPRTTRTQLAEVQKYVLRLKPNIEGFYATYHTFPGNNTEAGLPPSSNLVSNYITGVSVDNGVINVSIGNNAHGAIKGMVLSFQPLTVQGNASSPIDWTCGYSTAPAGMSANGANSTTIPAKYLPFDCLAHEIK